MTKKNSALYPTEDQFHKTYLQILEICDRFGNESGTGEGDYWLRDDNYGNYDHHICVTNIRFLKTNVVPELLRYVRCNAQQWTIIVTIDTDTKLPDMSLLISDNGIEDKLIRKYLPGEFESLPHDDIT